MLLGKCVSGTLQADANLLVLSGEHGVIGVESTLQRFDTLRKLVISKYETLVLIA